MKQKACDFAGQSLNRGSEIEHKSRINCNLKFTSSIIINKY